MLRYCQNMEYDQEEVVDCIYFLLDEMQSNAALQQLRSEVAGVLTRLFFGQNYSVIKNCKENMEKVEMIRQFLQDPSVAAKVREVVETGSDFVKKNYRQFF